MPGPPRNYWLLLGAFFVSTAGDWLYRLALPLLVLQMTGSTVQTAAVYTLEFLPYVLVAPIGGVIADRVDRRLLLIRTDAVATAIVGVLALLVWRGDQQLWMVYAAAFVLSGTRPLYHASFQGLIPATVPPDRLSWANSRLQATQSALDLAGPLLGAAALAALGVAGGLTLDAASFLLSAAAIALVTSRVAMPTERVSIGADLRTGIRFIRDTPALLWGALLAAGSVFGITTVETNLITYLVRFQGQPVAAVGVVFAALGAGALAGALLAPKVIKAVPPGNLIIGCMLGCGAAAASLMVLRDVAAIAACLALSGAGAMIFTVTFHTLRHQLVPVHLLGRVVMMTRLMAFVTMPIAPIIGGAILESTGQFWPVAALSAVTQLGVGLLALFTPLRERGTTHAARGGR